MRFSNSLSLRSAFAFLLFSGVLAACSGGDDPAGPDVDPPSAPANARITTPGDQSITVAWDAVTGATGYNIYLASQGGVTKANYTTKTDGQKRTSTTASSAISGLANGKTYYFVITATNSGGESGESAEVSSTPQPAYNPAASAALAAGTYAYSSMNVPAGVTITAGGGVVINVSGSATVNGTLAADCQAIEMRVSGDLVVDGLIRNNCTVPPLGDAPNIKIVADGALTIGSTISAQDAIVSDGSIRISDISTENLVLPAILPGSLALADHAAAGEPVLGAGGPAKFNRPVRAGKGKSVETTRDGPIDVGGAITAGNGADAPGKMQGPICDNSLAIGGKGGSIYLVARGSTLTFAAGSSLRAGDGGKGGSCIATGCPATAIAGKGGDGGGVLIGGQNITFGAGVIITRGNGGTGGDATATGDAGATPCANGCAANATAGLGGGTGGAGYGITSPGTVVGNPNEDGGNGGTGGVATATGGAGQDCNICPSGKGGDGGVATATGGRGGDGATGNVWPIAAGSHRKGNGGTADAKGGHAGHGADCCLKFDEKPGGNGGKGGDATSTGGQIGAAGIGAGVRGAEVGGGGSAGDGGDGEGPGAPGANGIGTGAVTDISDGETGVPGQPCPNPLLGYIYFSTLPTGTITPGANFTLGLFPEPDPLLPVLGTVPIHFLTSAEFGGTVGYNKLASGTIQVGSGGYSADLAPLMPNFPVNIVSILIQAFCTVPNCVELIGYYQGVERARVGTIAGGGSQNLELPVAGETFPRYDRFVVRGTGAFNFFHWWVIIVDP